MSSKINIYDFEFHLTGHGVYKVTYTSPKTEKKWTSYISTMTLIDKTKNADEPKIKDLNELKRLCKMEKFI